MTQELMESTIRQWVSADPRRGARDLSRLSPSTGRSISRSPEEVADELIILAGRRQIAATRIW
ncbi:hypothetical protein G7077_12395 [Sphingomonas piscis]|uniref:Uncharacterized protein n=1 Tax=Sphingomonas piscis TaxID=2714943 RepID=A0A6G7YS66_9SPHN|nr:hypothetical protein [Sphingomonas piscis]QIK79588.1 hypothetical protein G7077_12395 [Sphingomonas piscis]